MDSQPQQETIEVISNSPNNSGKWQPAIGQETQTLLNYLPISKQSKGLLEQSGSDILGKCVDPNSPVNNATGIVIGHVQSGKTMSFTTVATLARDNRYPLVIVITGISVPLFDQSSKRLEKDLRLATRDDRKWVHIRNPKLGGSDQNTIKSALAGWHDPHTPDTARRTVLITVMKNTRHLDNLVQLLHTLTLNGIPALIIDDEADQAGLNTRVKQGGESATYQRLLALRDNLPQHSFLQYTATPQAPLLISLIDQLSPEFAEILTPGPDYTGGEIFFLNRKDLVETIPDSEIPGDNIIEEAPESLLRAMRLFFLGVAAGIFEDPDKAGKGNRSMLVHPSQKNYGPSAISALGSRSPAAMASNP